MATIGPANDTPELLDELLRAGVDVVRLNLSHGPIEQHLVRMQAVRDAAERTGLVVAVLGDLPGPKIRSGKFPDEGAYWAEGDLVQLQVGNEASTTTLVNVDYATLLEDVKPGERCVIGDGAISLMVTVVADHKVNCVVVSGGRFAGRPGRPPAVGTFAARHADRAGPRTRCADGCSGGSVHRHEQCGR